MHRFFITPDQIAHLIVRFDDDQAHQLRRVLRLRPGDRVLALDGAGLQYEVVLEEVSNSRVTGLIAGKTAAVGEPGTRLTLFQSLVKREKFEWVLQKGTELGVADFCPVITRRTLVRDEEDVKPEKLDRWRRIIKEAAEQSGRGLLPRLTAPIPFEAAAPETLLNDRALIAWEMEAQRTIRNALAERDGPQEIALFIGPEGGFEQQEVDEAMWYGAIPVTLGPRTLRTETAAIVAVSLVMHELGEMDRRHE
jgi:16S rRNA (uracil1498-N3)-methyltransferase